MKKTYAERHFILTNILVFFLLVISSNSGYSSTLIDDASSTEFRQHETLKILLKKPVDKNNVWQLTRFAISAYSLNKQVEEANNAIVQINKILAKNEFSNAHWHIYTLARLYWLFSSEGENKRMSNLAESTLRELFLQFLKVTEYLKPTMSDEEYLWAYQSSENHHLQAYISIWSAAKILNTSKKHSRVKDISLVKLASSLEAYFKSYFRERVTKGLLSEVASPTYAKYSLNSLLNLYDFTTDKELKALADMFLIVYYADWYLEQDNGLRGGSKHRAYPGINSYRLDDSLGWIPFGLGKPSIHPVFLNSLTTTWRPHKTLSDLVNIDKGAYEILSRRPGLRSKNGNKRTAARLGGMLLKYSYVTPQFIAGTSMVPAIHSDKWTNISSQNRRNEILFRGDSSAKLFTQRPNPPNYRSVYNAEWGVQDKGVMILQLMPQPYSKNAHGQLIFFSNSLKPILRKGWYFFESDLTYAAVKVVKGGANFRPPSLKDYRNNKGDTSAGSYLELDNKLSPIIIEVNNKASFRDLSHFQQQIFSNPLTLEKEVLKYSSQAYKNQLTLYTDYSQAPEVNNISINYNPHFAFQSKYLNAEFGGKVVYLSSGNEILELDFEKAIAIVQAAKARK